ncbi:VanZ family protein [Amedibacillus sp. YH-ame6]
MKRKHIYLILCFIWMAVIFWFSAQVADDSQGMSNKLIELIDRIFNINLVENGGWLFDVASFIVRKLAHMSEYAVLAILFALYFKEINVQHYGVYAIVAVFLYASTDEFHQLFVKGRSGQFKDVLIDTFGGTLGFMLLQIYYKVLIKYKERRKIKQL